MKTSFLTRKYKKQGITSGRTNTLNATKIRLSMTGCITGGSEALKGNEEALNDDGKALKGIGAMKRQPRGI